MCNFISSVAILKDGKIKVVTSDDSDSHSDILKSLGIEDTKKIPDFVKMELTPVSKIDNSALSLSLQNMKSWIEKVDQDNLPVWWTSTVRKKAFNILRSKVKKMLITGEIDVIGKGRWILLEGAIVVEARDAKITYMLGNSQIKTLCGSSKVNKMYEKSKIFKMYDNSVIDIMLNNSKVGKMYNNSEINKMYNNSKVNEMHNTSIVIVMWDSCGIGKMYDTSAVGTMHFNSEVKKMYHASKVKLMCDNSKVGVMYNNTQVDIMWDYSEVGKMYNNSKISERHHITKVFDKTHNKNKNSVVIP